MNYHDGLRNAEIMSKLQRGKSKNAALYKTRDDETKVIQK